MFELLAEVLELLLVGIPVSILDKTFALLAPYIAIRTLIAFNLVSLKLVKLNPFDVVP